MFHLLTEDFHGSVLHRPGRRLLCPDSWPGGLFRPLAEVVMAPLYLIALAAAIGLFAYLLAVLFYPEDFS